MHFLEALNNDIRALNSQDRVRFEARFHYYLSSVLVTFLDFERADGETGNYHEFYQCTYCSVSFIQFIVVDKIVFTLLHTLLFKYLVFSHQRLFISIEHSCILNYIIISRFRSNPFFSGSLSLVGFLVCHRCVSSSVAIVEIRWHWLNFNNDNSKLQLIAVRAVKPKP